MSREKNPTFPKIIGYIRSNCKSPAHSAVPTMSLANRFRQAKWLDKNNFGPQVFLFRNLESGQVIYSQLPTFSDYQMKKQFQRPNWQNRRPTTRRDIWRLMAVANFSNYEAAVKAYENLVRLRSWRDITLKDVAMKYRPRNKDGNIWYSAQFRPIYTQEAVADLSSAIETVGKPVTIQWEDEWRKGELQNWNNELVQHDILDRISLQNPKSLLEELRIKARGEFLKLRKQEAQATEEFEGQIEKAL